MEISDIIKSFDDRLFKVDSECFIIYTGDSLDDDKPFIRIGNWTELPVELIPLIENIIVTDRLLGDPSEEQFNIDIKYLESNRYIGSEHILKKYLDFQTLFGLDLTNASIVNIEKDIPELSMEKNISGRNQFIGLFYRNGNFKIICEKKYIFNLEEIEQDPVNNSKIHDYISLKNKGSKRFKGSGIMLFDKSLMFYNNKYFTSFYFPRNYFDDFINLNIDPEKINNIIFQSENFTNLAKFIKWKHSINDKINVYSDYKDQLSLFRNIFNRCILNRGDFTGMDFTTNDGLNIVNYSNTDNIKAIYKKISPANDEFISALIVERKGIEDIIKEKIDIIFVYYTVYEKTNLLFKSSSTPVVIIDDGNRNILKLKNTDIIILNNRIQYEFQKFNDISGILNAHNINDEIITDLYNNKIYDINSIMNSLIDPDKDKLGNEIILFNCLSFIKIFLYNTDDRKLAQKLKEIHYEISLKVNYNFLYKQNRGMKIIIILLNNSVFQFILKLDNIEDNSYSNQSKPDEELFNISDKFINDDDWRIFNKKIKDDRKRLKELLGLYINHLEVKYNKDDFIQLSDAIIKRKKLLSDNNFEINLFQNTHNNNRSNENNYSEIPARNKKTQGANSSMINIKKIIFTLFAAVMILIILIKLNEKPENIAKKNKVIIKNKKFEIEKDYIEKYSIKISNIEIYNYANKIALKNNYNRILLSSIRKKNPDWIYPSNVIKMLDNETIIVKKGDNLWNLSNQKLIQISIYFYKTVEKISDINDNSIKKELIKKAAKYAFSKKHFEIIKKISEENKWK